MKKTIGSYNVVKELGEGAFSTVYLATHNKTKKRVAIKVVNLDLVVENDMEEQLQREISIMYEMDHPGLIQLYEVLRSPTQIFLVLECAEGGELFNILATDGALDEDTARSYFQQLIDALDYMHLKKTAHRDLKPENLLLDNAGHLKIADFGLSIMSHTTSAVLQTKCGTPNYVAPEVLSSGIGYNGSAADLWSAGCILYVMLAAALPFDSEVLQDLARQIMTVSVVYPPTFPPGAVDLMRHLICGDPKKRYKAADVRAHPWFKQNYHPIVGRDISSPRTFRPELVIQLDAQNKILPGQIIPEKLSQNSAPNSAQNPPQSPPKSTQNPGQKPAQNAGEEETINAFELIGKLTAVTIGDQDGATEDSGKTAFSTAKGTNELHTILKAVMSEYKASLKDQGNGIVRATLKMNAHHIILTIKITTLTPEARLVEVHRMKGNTLDFFRVFKRLKDKMKA